MSPSPPGREEPASQTAWHLQRCDGFLDLGMREQARAELNQVRQQDRATTACLRMRLRLLIEEGAWAEAVPLADELRAREPKDPTFVIQLAYATRRTAGIDAAEKILRDALKTFPKVALIHFNLSCYACQTGRRDEAVACLARAVALEPALHQTALEDEDLSPIWPDIGG